MKKLELPSKLEQLKSAKTRADLAQILGYSLKGLTYVVYGLSLDEKYREFSIKKKSGGVRTISAPCELLKCLQSRLAELLLTCLEEIHETQEKPVSKFSHGFSKGKSIFTNGVKHKNKRFVFNLDIEDFFGSITFSRIRGYFIKNKYFLLDSRVATLIAHIACKGKILPQGSPLSPVISNMIGEILDSRLSRLAHKNGCTYTRYADDITFSTNRKEFPSFIAKRLESDPLKWELGRSLEKVFEKSNFSVNKQKIRMQNKIHRQEVTGLVVNKATNTPSEYRYLARALVHRLVTKGDFYIKSESPGSDNLIGSEEKLQGMLNHIVQAKRNCINRKKEEGKSLSKPREISSEESLYKKFIAYTRFFRPKIPILMFEGKTDSVHIKSAIRNCGLDLSSLFDKDLNRFSVKFQSHHTYSGNSFNNILGVSSGGAGYFCKLINDFYILFRGFRLDASGEPVVIILDKDKAGNDVLNNIMSKYSKNKIHRPRELGKGVFHIFYNLYLIFIPEISGRRVNDIESLYHDDLRSEWVDNETEKVPENKKARFSLYVKQNSSTIDFSNFVSFLRELDRIIGDHRAGLCR